jgi:cell division protein FtsL
MNKKADRVLWMGGDSKAKSKTQSKASRSKSSKIFCLALLMFFLMAGSLFYVWSRVQVIQLGYAISGGLKQGKKLLETNKKLRLEIATLKSYARIEKLATEELKMSKPKPDQVIVIR